MLRSQHRVYEDSGEVARTQDVWGAEGISGRVKFLPLAWAGMPKTSFRKNSDSPLVSLLTIFTIISCNLKFWAGSNRANQLSKKCSAIKVRNVVLSSLSCLLNTAVA